MPGAWPLSRFLPKSVSRNTLCSAVSAGERALIGPRAGTILRPPIRVSTLPRLSARILTAVLVIALAEVALPRVIYDPLVPGKRYGRNAHLRRDWDNYIRVTSLPSDPEIRVLLLSNSQGNGPEYPEPVIYPWRLQDLLNEGRSGPPVKVINWSYGPNRVPEAVLLLARAQELRPHVVLAVFHPGWFQEADLVWNGKPTPLSMFPGDVVDTAWLYRGQVPPEFRTRYLRPVTAVSALLARAWPTYRFRDLPVSYLQVRLPWFRPFVPEGEWAAWFLAGRARRSRLQAQPVAGRLPPPPTPPLVDMFLEASARTGAARRVFVYQPHYFRVADPGEGPELLRRMLQDAGVEVWNMGDTVPWTQFLEGQNLHLADDGHLTFAAALAERLRPIVDDLPAAR
jgi:hypothetical protein